MRRPDRRLTLRAQLVLGSIGVVLVTFTALAVLLAVFFGHYFAAARVGALRTRAYRIARLLRQPTPRARVRIAALLRGEGGHVWIVTAAGVVTEQFGPRRFGRYEAWVSAGDLAAVVAGRDLARIVHPGGTGPQEVAVVGVPLHAAARRGAVLWVAAVGGGAILRAVAARVALVTALGLLLAAVLFAWLASRVARPIRRLEGAAGRIAAGHFDVPIEEAGPREVRSLARSLRGMGARLSDLDRSRRDFLADVSHELRSPLAALRGALEGIRAGTASRTDRGRYLAVAAGETARLGRLVDDLLALSRARSGRLDLHRRAVDLNEATLRVALSLEPVADARQVVFRFEVPEVPVSVDADPDRLSQVLWNLLDNAVRHTPAGAEVSVRVAPGRLEVCNPGAVIPPEVAERLFERFERADPGGGGGGTGLGLAIARTLVEAHGGRIEVRAPPEGGLFLRVRWPEAEPGREPESEPGGGG